MRIDAILWTSEESLFKDIDATDVKWSKRSRGRNFMVSVDVQSKSFARAKRQTASTDLSIDSPHWKVAFSVTAPNAELLACEWVIMSFEAQKHSAGILFGTNYLTEFECPYCSFGRTQSGPLRLGRAGIIDSKECYETLAGEFIVKQSVVDVLSACDKNATYISPVLNAKKSKHSSDQARDRTGTALYQIVSSGDSFGLHDSTLFYCGFDVHPIDLALRSKPCRYTIQEWIYGVPKAIVLESPKSKLCTFNERFMGYPNTSLLGSKCILLAHADLCRAILQSGIKGFNLSPVDIV